MKRISDRQETNDFLDNLYRIKANNPWHNRIRKYTMASNYILSINDNTLIRIVSDSIWNKYPSYRHGYISNPSAEVAQYDYGEILISVFSEIISFDSNIKSILTEHGVGMLFGVAVIDSGSNFNDLFFKSAASKDPRVRRAIASVCSIKQLATFKNDSNASIRKIVISRLGIKNCYKDFLNDKSKYIRYASYLEADLSEFDYKGVLNSYLSKKTPIKNADSKLVINIIRKMKKEDVVFYMFLSSNNTDIKRAIERKLIS